MLTVTSESPALIVTLDALGTTLMVLEPVRLVPKFNVLLAPKLLIVAVLGAIKGLAVLLIVIVELMILLVSMAKLVFLNFLM